MVFWIAILSGALFAWLAVRIGFCETWVLLFNIVIAIYVAVFLAPSVAAMAGGPGGGSAWGMALSLLILAGGSFALLHGLTFVFLTGQFRIPFPSLFDLVLSGALGFVAGFLVLSFAALVLAASPLVDHSLVATVGLRPDSQRADLSFLAWCCDLVHSVASGDEEEDPTQAAVARLLELSRPSPAGTNPRVDADESLQPSASPSQAGPSPTMQRGGRAIAPDPVDE